MFESEGGFYDNRKEGEALVYENIGRWEHWGWLLQDIKGENGMNERESALNLHIWSWSSFCLSFDNKMREGVEFSVLCSVSVSQKSFSRLVDKRFSLPSTNSWLSLRVTSHFSHSLTFFCPSLSRKSFRAAPDRGDNNPQATYVVTYLGGRGRKPSLYLPERPWSIRENEKSPILSDGESYEMTHFINSSFCSWVCYTNMCCTKHSFEIFETDRHISYLVWSTFRLACKWWLPKEDKGKRE